MNFDIKNSTEVLATWDRCDVFSILPFLPDPDLVLRKIGGGIDKYNENLNDPTVSGCLDRRKAGTISKKWSVDIDNSDTGIHLAVIRFMKKLPIKKIIGQALDAVYYGFQPLEVMWSFIDGVYIPSAIIGKPSKWFIFGKNNELLLRTKKNPNGEPVPEKKFLLAQHQPTFANPYGKKIAANIYWYCLFKKNGLKWWVTFLEKFGTPYIIGKTPRGSTDEQKKDLVGMLSKMIRDAVAVIPDDSSVEFLQATQNTSKSSGGQIANTQHEALVQFCDDAICKAILGHSGAAHSTPGKLGGMNIAMQATQDLIDADSSMVCDLFNQLIDWFVELNSNAVRSGIRRPAFSLRSKDDVNLSVALRDKKLAETGQIKFTKKYLMKTYNLMEDDFV
jgi:phage gp29-like protein